MRANLNNIPCRSRKFVFFFVSICTFSFFTLLFSQTLVKVNAEVDKSAITIGDRITYTLTIVHDKNIRIEQPGPGANLGAFEIKDYKILDPTEENGLISQKFEYNISVFDTGHFVIPSFPVAFFPGDTTKQYQIIQSEPIPVEVKSVLTAENSEIKDIKPPITIPFNYRRLFWYILAGLLLLLAAGIAFYVIQQRKKGVPIFRKEPIRPAHEIAFEEIARLRERISQLQTADDYKRYYTDLSGILRRYLENRYFIEALEETTAEIQESLQETELETISAGHIGDLLSLSDLVKFARFLPPQDEAEKSADLLHDIVESTRLVFKPETGTERPVEEGGAEILNQAAESTTD